MQLQRHLARVVLESTDGSGDGDHNGRRDDNARVRVCVPFHVASSSVDMRQMIFTQGQQSDQDSQAGNSEEQRDGLAVYGGRAKDLCQKMARLHSDWSLAPACDPVLQA